MSRKRYAIGELAAAAGVSRRTVRYYVQQGLLPAPLGRGRGEHYDDSHLATLLRIKALQEQGLTLEEIKRRFGGNEGLGAPQVSDMAVRLRKPAPGERWLRQTVMPGYELHVQEGFAALDEGQLRRLALTLQELLQDENR
ncbi:hypothetical protein EG19_01020 [Thermoanaerobaculum aquaticum]|uniref:HTH merR-type domain-containing protein n=1 Tax=Thermoanaerobaculum aquaticum TaxID=1312852 RepID=A0A062XXM4_9BACT|nr:MerR family transcriptional regulator [Thermoanaerobaculum aquaticum]KDA54179.1 hypothetical protein EG19_01020 [Thermoanaerobaculum aquaticum]BCW92216.1 MAG: hypothetical protein KatS3mg007_0110 [Thermoanaerobaculum sp.]GBC80394.1 Mercuric resistance operon regulatory protein [bacterium HR09]